MHPESNIKSAKIEVYPSITAPIGEQGGDPDSIDFCYRIGLDYVSCSPFRIPIARLSCAQVTVNNGSVDPKYGKKPNA